MINMKSQDRLFSLLISERVSFGKILFWKHSFKKNSCGRIFFQKYSVPKKKGLREGGWAWLFVRDRC